MQRLSKLQSNLHTASAPVLPTAGQLLLRAPSTMSLGPIGTGAADSPVHASHDRRPSVSFLFSPKEGEHSEGPPKGRKAQLRHKLNELLRDAEPVGLPPSAASTGSRGLRSPSARLSGSALFGAASSLPTVSEGPTDADARGSESPLEKRRFTFE